MFGEKRARPGTDQSFKGASLLRAGRRDLGRYRSTCSWWPPLQTPTSPGLACTPTLAAACTPLRLDTPPLAAWPCSPLLTSCATLSR